ncbi:Zinc transporter 5, partial [Cymbomonas tetramitiformis]
MDVLEAHGALSVEEDSSSPELIKWKLVALAIIFASSCVGLLLPKILYAWRPSPGSFGLANMFSFGVILSVSLVHLLSDAIADLPEESNTLGIASAASYLVLTILEGSCSDGHDHVLPDIEELVPDVRQHVHSNPPTCGITAPSNDGSTCEKMEPSVVDWEAPPPSAPDSSELGSDPFLEKLLTKHDEIREESIQARDRAKRIKAQILYLVLSLHSLLEGLTLGAQASLESLLDSFLAITMHKV